MRFLPLAPTSQRSERTSHASMVMRFSWFAATPARGRPPSSMLCAWPCTASYPARAVAELSNSIETLPSMSAPRQPMTHWPPEWSWSLTLVTVATDSRASLHSAGPAALSSITRRPWKNGWTDNGSLWSRASTRSTSLPRTTLDLTRSSSLNLSCFHRESSPSFSRLISRLARTSSRSSSR